MHGIAGDAAHLLWVVWLIAFHDERLATWLHGRCHLLASMPLGLGYPRRHCANVQLGQVETHHQHLFMALATLIVCNTRQHVFMALATIINTCCTLPIQNTHMLARVRAQLVKKRLCFPSSKKVPCGLSIPINT